MSEQALLAEERGTGSRERPPEPCFKPQEVF